MDEGKQHLWTIVCFVVVVVCLAATFAYADSHIQALPDGGIEMNGKCYDIVDLKDQDTFLVECGNPDRRGFNEPNCVLLGGKWFKEFEMCLLDEYEWTIDREGNYNIQRYHSTHTEV